MSPRSADAAGVLLYGAPGTGKDTVTAALTVTGRFAHFPPLKCGSGRAAGYRPITSDELLALDPDEILWRTNAYESVYVVDRSGVEAVLAAGLIPVLHLGVPAAVEAIPSRMAHIDWLTVELSCPREVAHARIVARRTGDAAARMARWDATPHLEHAALRIDTSSTAASDAADEIRRMVQHRRP